MRDESSELWRNSRPPHRALEMVVVVPVRDEARHLTATLQALASQLDLTGRPYEPAKFEILLLANNCNDHSARLARDFARSHPQLALHVEEIELPVDDAHIGHVRRLLMDAACRRLAQASDDQAFVLSTDGDTMVDRYWLARTAEEFALGADAVGGRIALDPCEGLDASTLRHHRYDAAYRLSVAKLESLVDPDPADPWPRHHQHFGASLAVRRVAYLAVGGIPAVRYLEDEALVSAMRRADLRIRHSPNVHVVTSSRRQGRVEVGLSWQLQRWASTPEAAKGMFVDDASHTANEIFTRCRARAAWNCDGAQDWNAMARALGPALSVSDVWLRETAAATSTFGAFWQQVCHRRHLATTVPQVPIRQALRQLRELTRALAGAPARGLTTNLSCQQAPVPRRATGLALALGSQHRQAA